MRVTLVTRLSVTNDILVYNGVAVAAAATLMLKLLIDSDSHLQAQPMQQTSQISKGRRYQRKASSLVFGNTNKQTNKQINQTWVI